jgi:hypothetical protein
MIRLIAIISAIVIAGLLAWEFVPLQVARWDGGYDLTVLVASPPGTLRAVSCEAFSKREGALQSMESPEVSWSAVAQPFSGEPLTVHVPMSGRASPCGRELKRSQFGYLLVIGDLPDGQRVGKVVKIPDGRVSRTTRVQLP